MPVVLESYSVREIAPFVYVPVLDGRPLAIRYKNPDRALARARDAFCRRAEARSFFAARREAHRLVDARELLLASREAGLAVAREVLLAYGDQGVAVACEVIRAAGEPGS